MPFQIQCESITNYLIAYVVFYFVQTEIADLAGLREPTKQQFQMLLDAAEKMFPASSATPVTRSMLHGWMPNISDEVSSRILLQRNMAAMNVMKSKMEQGSKKRQQKILESIDKGNGNGKEGNSEWSIESK